MIFQTLILEERGREGKTEGKCASVIIWKKKNILFQGFPGAEVVKNQPANAGDAGDTGSISELGRSSRVGYSNPFQYSCL